MHFWISKPAGRSRIIRGTAGCRRPAVVAAVTASSIPASIPLLKTRGQPGSRRGDCLVGGSMIPPNRLNNNGSANSRSGEQSTRQPPRCNGHLRFNDEQQQQTTSSSRRAQQTSTLSGHVTTLNHPRTSLASESSVNRGILEFPEMGDAELASYKLRCGVWITFVLATGFVSIAKFYFGNRPDTGLDVLIFCGLLVTLLISGCFFSLTRRARNVERAQPSHQEVCPHHVCYYAVNSAELRPPVSTLRVPVSSPTPPPISPSPPPYHIAILIPQSEGQDIEAPPPSYDKATRPSETSSVSD